MPSYAWRCSACSRVNAGGTNRCALCMCPAEVTLAQAEGYRKALELARSCGQEPIVLSEFYESRAVIPAKDPSRIFPLETRRALQKIANRSALLVGCGAAAAIALITLGILYWDLASSKYRLTMLSMAAVALTIGPVVIYLSRLKCPRCGMKWISGNYKENVYGSYLIWAIGRWESCGACGTSVQRSER